MSSIEKHPERNVIRVQLAHNLVLKGKVFGTMPMAATLTPEEARNFRKLLTPKLTWFLLTLPFRKGGK